MKVLLTTLMLIASATLIGCAGYADQGADASSLNNQFPTGLGENADNRAQDLLFRHDIQGAKVEFDELKRRSPDRAGLPAAGSAVTTLLLLPYSDASRQILTTHFDARDGLDAQGDVIWGDQGFIFFTSRGVAWDDSPSTVGIKTLLVDRLPWSRRALDTLDGFVDGLDNPVALLSEDLVPLAEELKAIATDLDVALNDDGFATLFVPGEVFWDEELDLVLGKSELSFLRGAVKAAEAGLYFFAAYEHAWTIERAFGESIWTDIIENAADPDHIAGGEPIDYQVAHLNESLGRAIAAADRLDSAKAATGEALRAFADAITFGVSEQADTTLDWPADDADVAAQLSEFIHALADSVEGSTELPYTAPSQEADLSLLFDGRTIAPEENLLVVDRYDDGFDIVAETAVVEETLSSFLDGIFVPPFDSEPAPELTIQDAVDDLINNVSSDISNDLERSVGGAF